MRWVQSWQVPSGSNPRRTYTVSRAADGSYGCSCPAWRFCGERAACKHIQFHLAQQQRAVAVAPPAPRVVTTTRGPSRDARPRLGDLLKVRAPAPAPAPTSPAMALDALLTAVEPRAGRKDR